MAQISHRLSLRATPEDVFEALVQPDRLRAWMTRRMEAEPVAGTQSLMRFDEGRFVLRTRVAELSPGEMVRWEVLGDGAELRETAIVFELTPDRQNGGFSQLEFRHEGWERESESFRQAGKLWDSALRSLRDYVETGEGNPDAG